MSVLITKGSQSGFINVPASKSVLHRLLMCASVSDNELTLLGCSLSDDINATLSIIKHWCSVSVDNRTIRIKGHGGVKPSLLPLNAHESGTTLRLLIPLLATLEKPVKIKGQGRLLERPLNVYEEIFNKQGLTLIKEKEYVKIQGPLKADTFNVKGNVSSQFISGLLLALPLLESDSILKIEEPVVSQGYINLTLDTLKIFGIEIEEQSPFTYYIKGHQHYHTEFNTVMCEADWSQAAPFLVLGTLRGGVYLTGLNPKSHQGDKAILKYLTDAGADIGWEEGTIKVNASLIDHFDIDVDATPDLAPYLFLLASLGQNDSHFTGIGRLNDKESKRLDAMVEMCTTLGAQCKVTDNLLTIKPVSDKNYLNKTFALNTYHDHRLVQTAAIASAVSEGIVIDDWEAINKSYPNFFDDLGILGFQKSKY